MITLLGEETRKTDFSIDKLFVSRWSPRAMSGKPVKEEQLMALFETARWAPSAFNNQPWRFIYSLRDSRSWPKFFNLLHPGNKTWADKAATLVVVISKKTFDYNGKPTRTHSFDTGAAWASLALQGSLMGLVVHGMSGFEYDKAKKELDVPDNYQVEAMIAIGQPGNKANLPLNLQGIEKPSMRKKVKEFVFEGKFRTK